MSPLCFFWPGEGAGGLRWVWKPKGGVAARTRLPPTAAQPGWPCSQVLGAARDAVTPSLPALAPSVIQEEASVPLQGFHLFLYQVQGLWALSTVCHCTVKWDFFLSSEREVFSFSVSEVLSSSETASVVSHSTFRYLGMVGEKQCSLLKSSPGGEKSASRSLLL